MGLLTVALVLDLWLGDPDAIWNRLPHPVVLIGKLISWWDAKRNNRFLVSITGADANRSDFLLGVALIVILLAVSLLTALLVWEIGHRLFSLGWVIELLIVVSLMAQKSLADHVMRVVNDFRSDGLEGARHAVSMIVGRDVSQAGQSTVTRAAIESLAENFSDGVVAPVFWYLIFGLPGILFYKSVNTADSMIGHHSANYEHFGKAAAKLDDWMNWVPARLSAVLLIGAGIGQKKSAAMAAWATVQRDSGLHRSPNAGWPETAMAAVLGISLGGVRHYAEGAVNASILNASGREALTIADISVALSLYRQTCFVLLAFVVLLWALYLVFL